MKPLGPLDSLAGDRLSDRHRIGGRSLVTLGGNLSFPQRCQRLAALGRFTCERLSPPAELG